MEELRNAKNRQRSAPDMSKASTEGGSATATEKENAARDGDAVLTSAMDVMMESPVLAGGPHELHGQNIDDPEAEASAAEALLALVNHP